MDYVSNFRPGTSLFHKLHPVPKITWFILLTYVVLIQSSLLILGGLYIVIIFISLSAGISLKSLLSRLRWIIVIIVFTVVINILFNAQTQAQEEVLFYLGTPNLPIRRLAVYYALRIAMWILILSNCGIIFLQTTSPKDVIYGLRSLGTPYKFAYALMIGMRYIPLIQDNTTSVVIAQKARGLERSNVKTIRIAWDLIRDRLTTSLILIFKQVKITANSLELRGYGKFKTRTDLYHISWHIRDAVFLLLFFSSVLFLSLYRFGALPFIPPIPSIYQLFWL